MQQCNTTARNNTLGNCSAGSMQRVFEKSFTLLHFSFSGRTHLDLSHTTSQFGQPLLQFFAIVFTFGAGNFATNQLATPFKRLFIPSSLGDGSVFTIDPHLLCATEIGELHIGQLNSEILEESPSLGKGSNVVEHGLATVAITRRLHCHDLNNPLELVQHQGCQSFAFHIFRNNHQRSLRLADLLKKRHEILGVADLLLMNEDVRVLHLADDFFLVGHEVR